MKYQKVILIILSKSHYFQWIA